MFAKVLAPTTSEGATAEETTLQKEVRRKLQECVTYSDAAVQRGRYGGALTNIFKQAKQLRDDHEQKIVIAPNIVVWTLKRLEHKKQKAFYFSQLLQDQFELRGWNEKYREQYEEALTYTDKYYVRWLEHRYFLYRLLNRLQPSEETVLAERAAHPDRRDNSELFIPQLPEEKEEEGDENWLHVSPEKKKKSISDIDEAAETFSRSIAEESQIFADTPVGIIGGMEVPPLGGAQGGGDPDPNRDMDDNDVEDQEVETEHAAAAPTVASDNEDPYNSALETSQHGSGMLQNAAASSAAASTHPTSTPTSGIVYTAASNVATQPQIMLPQSSSAQLATLRYHGGTFTPPTPQQHAAMQFPPPPPTLAQPPPPPPQPPTMQQSNQPAQGMPSHFPTPSQFPYTGMTSSQAHTIAVNHLNAPATLSTALSTNTTSTQVNTQRVASLGSRQNSATDPIAQILQNMQLGGSVSGGFLAPGGPVRAAQGPFRGHSMGTAPPGQAFVRPAQAPSAGIAPFPPVAGAASLPPAAGAASFPQPTNASPFSPATSAALFPVSGAQGAGNLPFMTMYSNSLASTFDVTNIIKAPFSGDTAEFPTFIMLWHKVHRILTDLKFDDREKFMILKQVLTGPALNYVKDLPVDSQESYVYSLNTLYGYFYDQRVNLTTIIKKLLSTPRSDGTWASRQKVHSALIAYSNSIACLQATPADVQFAYEITFCTSSLLDQGWNREWVKFCAKRKNFASPIGADVTFADLCENLFKTMREQTQIKQLGYANQAERERPRYGRAAAAAAQGKKVPANGGANDRRATSSERQGARARPPAQAGMAAAAAAAAAMGDRGGFKGQKAPTAGIKEACIFCRRPNGTQEHVHSFPLNCPRVKSKTLTPQKMRDMGKTARACRVCFSASHATNACTAPKQFVCRFTNRNGEKCGKRHNTIWHVDSGNTTFGKAAAAGGRFSQ